MLYACEAWTLNPDLQRRIQAVEMRCLRTLLGTSYKDHVTKEDCRRVTQQVHYYEHLLTTVKKRNSVWACYMLRRTYKDNPERGKEDGADRRRAGPITSLNGQGKASLSLRQSPILHQVEPTGTSFLHDTLIQRPYDPGGLRDQ